MPKLILIRSDNNPRILPIPAPAYAVAPAYHLNLSNDAVNAFQQSGYVSTFTYDPTQGDATSNRARFMKSMNEGESGSGYFIHFIILDTASFDNKFINLNGGTQGFKEIMQEDIQENKKDFSRSSLEPLKKDGTVWHIPQLDLQFPQVFNTETVDVEFGGRGFRTDFEILLGGNWQPYATCVSMTRSDFGTHFSSFIRNHRTNTYPTATELAAAFNNGQVPGASPIYNPLGFTSAQVDEKNTAADNYFQALHAKEARNKEEDSKRAERAAQMRTEEKEREQKENDKNRIEMEEKAVAWWDSLRPEQKNEAIVIYAKEANIPSEQVSFSSPTDLCNIKLAFDFAHAKFYTFDEHEEKTQRSMRDAKQKRSKEFPKGSNDRLRAKYQKQIIVAKEIVGDRESEAYDQLRDLDKKIYNIAMNKGLKKVDKIKELEKISSQINKIVAEHQEQTSQGNSSSSRFDASQHRLK